MKPMSSSEMKQHFNNLLLEAKILCNEGHWEAALIVYHEGLKIRPHSEECRTGEARASNVIRSHLGVLPHHLNYTSNLRKSNEILRTDITKDCTSLAYGPQFTELYQDLLFLKKTHKNEYFPKDKRLESMMSNINLLLKKKRVGNKKTNYNTKYEVVNKPSLQENWKSILKTLEEINEPSKLLQSALTYLHDLESSSEMENSKVQYEGEIYYLIMKAYVDLSDFAQAEDYKSRILKIALETKDEELEIRTRYLEGRAFALKGNYISAARTWQDLLKKTTDPDRLAHLLHEVGRCFFKSGKTETARAYGILSLEAAVEAKNDIWVKNVSLLLAQIEKVRECTIEALRYYKSAEAAARRLNDYRTISLIICETQKLNAVSNNSKMDVTSIDSVSTKTDQNIPSVQEKVKSPKEGPNSIEEEIDTKQ